MPSKPNDHETSTSIITPYLGHDGCVQQEKEVIKSGDVCVWGGGEEGRKGILYSVKWTSARLSNELGVT